MKAGYGSDDPTGEFVTRTDRPNILLIVFDCLSESDCITHADVIPVLCKLRRESLTYSKAYTCSPQAGPARASLFTGLDMSAHGVWTDGIALPDHETTLPERLAQNGYQTWLVGRRHLAGVSHWTTEHARADEYTHFDWAHGPLHRSRQNAYLQWLQSMAPETYAEIFPRQADPDHTLIPPTQRQAMSNLPDDLSFNTWVSSQAVKRIRGGEGDTPYFGIVGFVVGHSGGAHQGEPVTERLNETALRQADVALEKILEQTDDGKTVIICTAARGTAGDHMPRNAMENQAIHVPLIIRRPESKTGTVMEIVSTIDITPTIFECASVRPPHRVQGASLTSAQTRNWALSRLRAPDQPSQSALITQNWKLIATHGNPDEGNHTAIPAFRS